MKLTKAGFAKAFTLAVIIGGASVLSACNTNIDPDARWHQANEVNPTGTGDFGPLDDPWNTRSMISSGA